MSTLRNIARHHNTAIVLFDATLPHEAPKTFGRGILPFVPWTGRVPYTANDEAEAMGMFRDCPPIRGGSPDADRFVPSDADWADFRNAGRQGDDLEFVGAAG
jgi:hypothetical protein